MDNTIDDKEIVRIQIQGHWGWQVKLYHKSKQIRFFFSDSLYDGKANAYQIALAHREQVAQKIRHDQKAPEEKFRHDQKTTIEKIQHDQKNTADKIQPDQKSGITGISRMWIKSRKNAYDCFRACIRVKGRLRSKSFSVGKYGEQQAFYLACKWRRQQEIARDGTAQTPIPRH